MIRSLPTPRFLLQQLIHRRIEGEFAQRIERAFPTDAPTIARVRAQILAQAQLVHPTSAPLPAQRLVRRNLPRATTSFAVLAIVVAGGLAATAALTSHPAPSIQPAAFVLDMDRSAASLQDVLATAGAGDSAVLGTSLTTYQANLRKLRADLGLPGVDLVAAASGIRAQSLALASISNQVSAANLNLFQSVTADLNAIIAVLPAPTDNHPGPSAHPGSSDHPGPSDHPGQSAHPGTTDHPGPSDHAGNSDHPGPSDHPGNSNHPKPSHKPLPSQANGKAKGP